MGTTATKPTLPFSMPTGGALTQTGPFWAWDPKAYNEKILTINEDDSQQIEAEYQRYLDQTQINSSTW